MSKYITDNRFWSTINRLQWKRFKTFPIPSDWFSRATEIIYSEFRTLDERLGFADKIYEKQSLIKMSIEKYDSFHIYSLIDKLSTVTGNSLTEEDMIVLVSSVIGLGESAFDEVLSDPTNILKYFPPIFDSFSDILIPIWTEEDNK